MKNIKINKDQAITVMRNILREGCAIPMASIGNGGCGYSYVGPLLMEEDLMLIFSRLEDWSFRVIPASEISEEFSDCDLRFYDVCVEFSNNIGDYSEQYLLWDLDYYKD